MSAFMTFFLFLIKRNNELLIKGLSWDKKSWYRMKNIHLNLDQYLDTLGIDTTDNRFSTYFNHKISFLQSIFNMKKEDARLMALSSLDFDDYVVYLPVLNDEVAFSSLIKFQDKRNSNNNLFVKIVDPNPEDNDNGNNEQTEDQIKILKEQIEQLKTEKSNLQLQNNALSNDAQEFENKIKIIQDDKDKIIKNTEEEFKLEKSKLNKLIKDKDLIIAKLNSTIAKQAEELKEFNKS